MGRELRRVPPTWEHPKDREGHYQRLYDEAFDDAMRQWWQEALDWTTGEGLRDYCRNYPEAAARARREPLWAFTQWHGAPPDPDYYRERFAEGRATAWQVYETVSEGTPVSPVLPDIGALIVWLTSDHPEWGWRALTPQGAARFVEQGSAPSFVLHVGPSGSRLTEGAHSYDHSEED